MKKEPVRQLLCLRSDLQKQNLQTEPEHPKHMNRAGKAGKSIQPFLLITAPIDSDLH